MAMTEHAYSYEAARSFEDRRIQVLDGSAARKRANARRMQKVKLAVGVVAVLVYLLCVVFMEAKITIAGTQINTINAQISDLQQQSARQDLTIGALSSNERVETYAMTYLNMVYPDADRVYYLGEDASLNIAASLNQQTVTSSESDEIVEVSTLWTAINDFMSNFFGNTAFATSE